MTTTAAATADITAITRFRISASTRFISRGYRANQLIVAGTVEEADS